jgi:ferredoxin--NADP+ reductase
MDEIREEVKSVLPEVQSVGGNAEAFYSILEGAREKARECPSKLSFRMKFLRSPRRIVGDGKGKVKEVIFGVNQLELKDGEVISRGTGELETISTDTVIFSVGSRVDEGFGLPVAHRHFVTTPTPRFPVDGISYEVYNPELCAHCEDIFVSGWARMAGEGVVGLARRDGERGARAMLKYLGTLPTVNTVSIKEVLGQLPLLDKKIVTFEDVEKLRRAEQKIAAEKGLLDFKFDSNEAMVEIIEGD